MHVACVHAKSHSEREKEKKRECRKVRQQKENEWREGVVRGRDRAHALLLTECLCVPPKKKIIMLKHNVQCYGI